MKETTPEQLAAQITTEFKTVGKYEITAAGVVGLYPSGKTDMDQNPTLFTDFSFEADLGDGQGEKTHTVRAPGNVVQYAEKGIVEVIQVKRFNTISNLALIYNPAGSFIQIATFE